MPQVSWPPAPVLINIEGGEEAADGGLYFSCNAPQPPEDTILGIDEKSLSMVPVVGSPNSGSDVSTQAPEEQQPLSPLPWIKSRFVKVKTLQEAARNQGSVILMQDTSGGEDRPVAVKKMPNKWVKESAAEFRTARPWENENPWQDFEITKTLSESEDAEVRKIGLNYHGVFRDDASTYFVMDFAAGGDLFTLMQTWENQGLDLQNGRERRAWPIAIALLRRVAGLHAMGVAHRDVSLENVMLWENEEECKDEKELADTVRLIDFGMATKDTESLQPVSKASYQAPEIHAATDPSQKIPYDSFKVDSFSVGVTIYSLVTANYPWLSTKPDACKYFTYAQDMGLRAMLNRRKCRGERVSELLSEPMIQLVEGLTKPNPKERVSVTEALMTQEFLMEKRDAEVRRLVEGSRCGM